MIYIGDNNTSYNAIYYGNNVSSSGGTVSTVYCGYDVIWTVINSCFGSGYWTNAAPWNNNNGWKN